MQKQFLPFALAFSALASFAAAGVEHNDLRVGIAGHAFDHLGDIAEQARAAVMSGSTIIYSTGFGALGYQGWPTPSEAEKTHDATSAYLSEAKKNGLRLALGYVCATSIVKLENFARNWPEKFCAQFSAPPQKWLQQDREGKVLASWYGGDYQPACMNNPDWRTYEKFIVRQQLEAGHDGIFFDNPTVHPQGCYCQYCMTEFALFLVKSGEKIAAPSQNSLKFLRDLAASRPTDFMRFRCRIAADFLAEIRSYARTIKPGALITCNNSLNSPEVFFSQCRTYGYNIFEMSQAEDLVVVEDMSQQPRVLADGNLIEYGPVYELLQAISHGKPLVAVTIADGDYHTPPNLMRLAIAEAAAHNASYLSWPTWPANQRTRMISAVRPQADLLRRNATLLNDTEQRSDALLFLPFRRYLETADCQPLKIARALSRANVQFEVFCEEDFSEKLKVKSPSVLLIESPAVLLAPEIKLLETFQRRGGEIVWTEKENWLAELQKMVEKPSVEVRGWATIRATVRDQPKKRMVHLLNLNVQRVSSFEDKVTPASDVQLKVRVPFFSVHSVKALTADSAATQGLIPFKLQRDKTGASLEIKIPRLVVSTILVVE